MSRARSCLALAPLTRITRWRVKEGGRSCDCDLRGGRQGQSWSCNSPESAARVGRDGAAWWSGSPTVRTFRVRWGWRHAGHPLLGLSGEAFCQHKTNRTRVENNRGIQCPVYLGVCMYVCVCAGKIFRDRESRWCGKDGGWRGEERERADRGKKKREADRRGSLSLGLQTTVSFLKPELCAHGRGWGVEVCSSSGCTSQRGQQFIP